MTTHTIPYGAADSFESIWFDPRFMTTDTRLVSDIMVAEGKIHIEQNPWCTTASGARDAYYTWVARMMAHADDRDRGRTRDALGAFVTELQAAALLPFLYRGDSVDVNDAQVQRLISDAQNIHQQSSDKYTDDQLAQFTDVQMEVYTSFYTNHCDVFEFFHKLIQTTIDQHSYREWTKGVPITQGLYFAARTEGFYYRDDVERINVLKVHAPRGLDNELRTFQLIAEGQTFTRYEHMQQYDKGCSGLIYKRLASVEDINNLNMPPMIDDDPDDGNV
jgi:predicted nucleic-acid-binding Zn-ribbon protein